MGNLGLLLYIRKRVAGGLVCGESWANVVVESLKQALNLESQLGEKLASADCEPLLVGPQRPFLYP